MFERSKNLLLLIVAPLLLGAGDPAGSGLTAYREQRYKEALGSWRRAVADAGDRIPPALLYNLALAAVQAGDRVEAEKAAERMAARGGAEFAARRDFLLGNVAFARCEMAARQALTPGAPPFAFDAAIALGRSALRAWARAATGRPDWPAAGRNVERVLLSLATLQDQRAAAMRERERLRAMKARPHLVPGAGGEEEGRKEEVAGDPKAQGQDSALSAARIKQIFGLLDRKAREKADLRSSRPARAAGGVEKDW